MQVINESGSKDERIRQESIPALIYIPDEEKPVLDTPEKTSEPIQKFPSKKEKRNAIKEFLKNENKDKKNNIENVKEMIEEVVPKILSESTNDYSEHDSTRLMGWMSEHLENVRQWIAFCTNPPVTDDPIQADQIQSKIDDYENKGYLRDANAIVDYIEGLLYYAIYNENLFGEHNYLINDVMHPVKGYKAIYDTLKSQTDKDDKIRYLNKLVICASRPLAVAESFEKAREFEPSISEGGVFQGEYGDGEQ